MYSTAIVLAAGVSSRFGADKLLLPLNGKTVIETVIDNLLSSNVSDIIVVTGHRAETVTRILQEKKVIVTNNAAYRQGMGTSLATGVKSASPETELYLIVLADMPLITGDIINQLIEKFLESPKTIAIPVYREKNGHPVLFSSRYREELLSLREDIGARGIIRAHPDEVLKIPVDSDAVVYDIDTEDRYQSLLERLQQER